MFRLVPILLLVAIATFSFATIRIVDNNPVNTNAYPTFDAARNASAAGDTIYVIGSPNNYSTFTFDRRLHVFGPGYFLSEQNPQPARTYNAYTDQLNFSSGSSGSTAQGIVCGSVSYYNTSSITLQRCFVSSWSTSWQITTNGACSNLIIQDNFINVGGNYNTNSIQLSDSRTVFIRNNIIWNYATGASSAAFTSNSNVGPYDISNNIIRGSINCVNANLTNNILYSGTIGGSALTGSNNICSGTQFSGWPNCILNVDMSTVFVDSGGSDSRYQLRTGSPAIGAGVNGIDCGMFAGIAPYVIGGIPAMPMVTTFIAPGTASTLYPLPVRIVARSHN